MTQEVLKLALEALEEINKLSIGENAICLPAEIDTAMDAIKEALALPDPYKQGYADAMNWKVQNHLEHLPTAQPEQEPVAMKFKIYKPTVPDPMRQGINNALLPWVYDQDRNSGFDATMWVTPVATLPPQRKPLTSKEIRAIEVEVAMSNSFAHPTKAEEFVRAIEAAHGIKENT